MSDSNTPSRKRSKWDNGDEDGVDAEAPQPKRRVLPKQQRMLNEPAASSSEPNTQRTRHVARSHSVYVPPRSAHPPIEASRSVYSYERLNQIEEGSYGVVFRARDKTTGDVVALKKLKLDEEKHGFPITALREINALMACRHENVVGIREIVVGDTLTQCVLSMCWLYR